MGTSARYSGSNNAGEAAWVANMATGDILRIGLYSGPEFTSTSNDYQYSRADSITDNGYLQGTTFRFSGSTSAGSAAWVADMGYSSTTRVGLYDDGGGIVYTGSNNYQESYITILTEAGRAAGYSKRYNGNAGEDGQTAWIYDLVSNTQISYELSVRPSDGYAFSNINGITSDGLAYGYFTLFSGEMNLGDRAFIWTADFGTLVLDDAISGGVAQFGWDYLANVDFANLAGVMVGLGLPDGSPNGRGVYMVQTVPEPGTAALLLLGAGALLFRRTRKTNT